MMHDGRRAGVNKYKFLAGGDHHPSSLREIGTYGYENGCIHILR